MNLYKYHTNPEKLIGGETPYLYSIEEAFRYLMYEHPDDELRLSIEKVIAKDPHKSLMYAEHTNKPFPLGEPEIATDSNWSYYYAKLVGPFKLGEPAMAKNPATAFHYATQILKNRFVAGEQSLKTSGWWDHYNDFLESIDHPRVE
jgi:hypothetical protein